MCMLLHHWIAFYPMDNEIHPFNNWAQTVITIEHPFDCVPTARLPYFLTTSFLLPLSFLHLFSYHYFVDAVRDIHSRIPEDVQLYFFGTSSCSEASASSLIKELQRSPLKPPPTDDTQLSSGECFSTFMSTSILP